MTVPTISNLPTVPATSDPNFETEAPALFNHIKNTFVSEMNSAISFINSSTFDATVEFKDGDFTAARNFLYMIDTSSAGVSVTLPLNPSTGDQLLLMDQKRSFGTNNLTIGRNGQNINGAASNVVSKSTGALIRCIFQSSYGWTVDLYEGEWESGTTAGDLVYNGGNVGIGTSAPTTKLEILGSPYSLTDSGNSVGGINLVTSSAQSNGNYTNAVSFGNGSDVAASAISGICTGDDPDNMGLAFITHPSEVGSADARESMRIDHLGNVRLNFTSHNTNNLRDSQTTTNRYPKFQINSTDGPAAGIGLISHNSSPAGFYSPQFWLAKSNGSVGQDTIVSDGTDLGSINFAGNDGSNFLNAASIRAEVEGTPSSNDMPGRLVFYTNSGQINPSPRLTIDSSGNVGIGTSAPSSTLHVQKDQATATAIRVQNGTANSASQAALYVNANGNNFSLINYPDADASNANFTRFTSTASGSKFIFAPDSTDTLTVAHTGNVGIGTSSPSGDLHIESDSTSATNLVLKNTATGGREYHLNCTANSSSIGGGNFALRDVTANAYRMVIDSSGNVEVNTGNLIIGTAGKGIDFSATSGTGTSELLDDYEEGTFTPTVSGTWTTNPTTLSGKYTKIGRMVYIQVEMTGGVKSSSISGYLTGLPIAVASSGTGSVTNVDVQDLGNCLFANTDRIWFTATNLGTAKIYVTGQYIAS